MATEDLATTPASGSTVTKNAAKAYLVRFNPHVLTEKYARQYEAYNP
jgi:hypothetical protein